MNRYAWVEAKRVPKVHRLDRRGRTYCQAENSSNRLSFAPSKPTKSSEDCKLCIELEERHGHRYA